MSMDPKVAERLAPRARRGRARLHSPATRSSRRMNAHLRSTRGIGGKAKHQVMFMMNSTGTPRLSRPRSLFGEVRSDPYEARSTAPRPWTTRARNRIANRRARASRKRNARG